MQLNRTSVSYLLIFFGLLGFVPNGIANPKDKLLQLVPDDTAISLVVNNLRSHTEALSKQKWLQNVDKASRVSGIKNSREFRNLLNIKKALKKHLQITWEKLRDDILGDCVIFAFNAKETGKAKQERGLILVWAKDYRELDRIVSLVNREQKRSKELKALIPKKYRDQTYYQRIADNDKQFYLQSEHLFAFTTHEPLIHHVIDRLRDSSTPSVMSRRVAQLPASHSLLTFWVNPRAFDAELQKQAEQAEGADSQVVKTFLKYWAALDGIGFSLNVSDNIEFYVSLQGRLEDLNPESQKLLRSTTQVPKLWGNFPEQQIFSVATRVDFPALLAALEDFMLPPVREKFRETLQKGLGAPLGMEFATEVLPYIGPDVGFSISPGAKEHLVPDALLAIRIQPGPEAAPVDQAIFRTLQFFVGLGVFDHNLKHGKADRIRFLTHKQQGDEVKYLVNGKFPPGLKPAFALKHGYLVAGSSPQAIARFKKSANPAPSGNTQLMLSFRELRSFLEVRHSELLGLAKKNRIPESFAREGMNRLLLGLGVFKSLSIEQEKSTGQITWKLLLEMAN